MALLPKRSVQGSSVKTDTARLVARVVKRLCEMGNDVESKSVQLEQCANISRGTEPVRRSIDCQARQLR